LLLPSLEIDLALSVLPPLPPLSPNPDTKAKAKHAMPRIIYANPQKTIVAIRHALTKNVLHMTFDTIAEVKKIADVLATLTIDSSSPPPIPQLILRLLVPDAHSSIPLGEKFGAKKNEIIQLTKAVIAHDLDIVGVSFHCGSGCHDPEAYAIALQLSRDAMVLMNGIIDDANNSAETAAAAGEDVVTVRRRKHIAILDIGGGFPGHDGAGGDEPRFCGGRATEEEEKGSRESSAAAEGEEVVETTLKIANVINPLVANIYAEFGDTLSIVAEPGRYFVEAAFALCCRIYSVRDNSSNSKNPTAGAAAAAREYFISQGVHGVFKDRLLCDEQYHPIPLRYHYDEENKEEESKVRQTIIHGPTEDAIDVIYSGELTTLNEDDWLIFDRMGAYTLSVAARDFGCNEIQFVNGICNAQD
jgi:ornithine decarboxylase